LRWGELQVRASIALRYLLDRLIGPRARADELCDVRIRLAEQAGRGVASHEEEQVALSLRLLREKLWARFGPVEACARCALPRSASWPGGDCCSGNTRDLFTDHELAALKLAGTTSSKLVAKSTRHSGCVFRDPEGCSLEAAHRPCVCVRYTCRELERELVRRGVGPESARLQEELRVEFERFVALRNERLEVDRL
jgi:hypothetical protein